MADSMLQKKRLVNLKIALTCWSPNYQHRGKGEAPILCFLGLLETWSWFFGCKYVCLQERWYCRHPGMGLSEEEHTHRRHGGKTGGVCSVAQPAVGSVPNKQVKGKILPRELMHTLSI